MTTEPNACVPLADGRCGLCGDEAVEMRVIEVDAANTTASCVASEGTRVIALDLVDDVLPGDAVLVHQGFAIARIPADAERRAT